MVFVFLWFDVRGHTHSCLVIILLSRSQYSLFIQQENNRVREFLFCRSMYCSCVPRSPVHFLSIPWFSGESRDRVKLCYKSKPLQNAAVLIAFERDSKTAAVLIAFVEYTFPFARITLNLKAYIFHIFC